MMKRVIPLLVAACLVLGAMLAGCGQAEQDHVSESQATKEITKDSVPLTMLASCSKAGSYVKLDYTGYASGKTTQKYVYVYLPYGYDPNDQETRYDVLYLYHGYGGDCTTFMGEPGDTRTLMDMVDNLTVQGRMNPMIIVNATYYPANGGPGDGGYNDIDLTMSYQEELLQYLIPAVEGTYHTYAQTTDLEGIKASRNHRIFGGFSMGGGMVVQHMSDCMDYFRYYLCMSGALYWCNTSHGDHYGAIGDGLWAGPYLAQAIQDQGYGPDDFFLYLVTGTSDVAYDAMETQVNALSQEDFFSFDNDQADGNVCYWTGEGEEHNYEAKRRYLYNALPVLSALINEQA